jgi:hypothetical protein
MKIQDRYTDRDHWSEEEQGDVAEAGDSDPMERGPKTLPSFGWFVIGYRALGTTYEEPERR